MSGPSIIPKNSRESIRVAIEEYQGHAYIDVRIYYIDGEDLKPTRKGIGIRPDLLPQVIEALQLAEAEARSQGLLLALPSTPQPASEMVADWLGEKRS